MLSNAYFLAKFRFDTAENEPAKNLQMLLIIFPILLPLASLPADPLYRRIPACASSLAFTGPICESRASAQAKYTTCRGLHKYRGRPKSTLDNLRTLELFYSG